VTVYFLVSRVKEPQKLFGPAFKPRDSIWHTFVEFCEFFRDKPAMPRGYDLSRDKKVLRFPSEALLIDIPATRSGTTPSTRKNYFRWEKGFADRLRLLSVPFLPTDQGGFEGLTARDRQRLGFKENDARFSERSIEYWWAEEEGFDIQQRLPTKCIDDLEQLFGKEIQFDFRGKVAVGYKHTRWTWLGILPSDLKEYPETPEAAAEKPDRGFTTPRGSIPVANGKRVRTERLSARRLPLLVPTDGASSAAKLFGGFERRPEGFENSCQQAVSSILEIPEDEQTKRHDTIRSPRCIDDLDAGDELWPLQLADHQYDLFYRKAAFPVPEGEPPLHVGSAATVYLRYLAEHAGTAGMLAEELAVDNRLKKRLAGKPNYLVIASNLDEAFLQKVLRERFGEELSGFTGTVLLLGRQGILDAVHSHYGIHREVIGHPLDLRPLENPSWTLPSGSERDGNPGMLLQAKYGLVSFDPAIRYEALQRLRAWLDDESAPVSVLLVTGAGGAGKTRLVSEFLRANARDWKTGAIRERVSTEELSTLASTSEPRLCAIDYCETRVDDLRFLLQQAIGGSNPQMPPLKILVTSRSVGDWWSDLDQDATLGPFIRRWEPIRLDAVGLDDVARQRLFEQATSDFSDFLSLAKPDSGISPNLDQAHFENPLFVLMAALLFVYSGGEPKGTDLPTSKEVLLDAILDHERRYWSKAIRGLDADFRTRKTVEKHLESVFTAIALLRGTQSEEQSVQLIDWVAPECRAEWQGLPQVMTELAHRLYPGAESITQQNELSIASLQPDMLAGQLIADNATQKMLDNLLARGVEPERLLRSLNRAAADSPRVSALLGEFLEKKLPDVAFPATKVAVESGEPISSLLAEALRQNRNLAFADMLVVFCRQEYVALREVTLVATELVLADALSHGQPEDEDRISEVAMLYDTLGVRLRGVNRFDEALDAAQRSVGLYNQLVAQGLADYCPSLGGALSNLGLVLMDLERYIEARLVLIEATDLLLKAASEHPEFYRSDVSVALDNLANCMACLGDPEEALAAGRLAVGVAREPSAQSADASNGVLAMALSHLSLTMQDQGLREDALDTVNEAIGLYRTLTAHNPSAHRPDLARCLSNVGSQLHGLGRFDEALDAAREARDLYQELAEQRPGDFLPKLVRSQNDVVSFLITSGLWEECLCAAERAIDLGRRLAKRHLGDSGFELARSFHDYAYLLNKFGRYEEGLVAVREAIDCYRELAAGHQDVFNSNLATSLHLEAGLLWGLGRSDEAFDSLADAIRNVGLATTGCPERFLEAKRMLDWYFELASELERGPDSELLEPVFDVMERHGWKYWPLK